LRKLSKPILPSEPEKAQIAIHGADHLYREVRIENTLTDETGKKFISNPVPKWKCHRGGARSDHCLRLIA